MLSKNLGSVPKQFSLFSFPPHVYPRFFIPDFPRFHTVRRYSLYDINRAIIQHIIQLFNNYYTRISYDISLYNVSLQLPNTTHKSLCVQASLLIGSQFTHWVLNSDKRKYSRPIKQLCVFYMRQWVNLFKEAFEQRTNY